MFVITNKTYHPNINKSLNNIPKLFIFPKVFVHNMTRVYYLFLALEIPNTIPNSEAMCFPGPAEDTASSSRTGRRQDPGYLVILNLVLRHPELDSVVIPYWQRLPAVRQEAARYGIPEDSG
jgi:hypothetical protein